MVSDKFSELKPSETLAINAKAIELKQKGLDVLNFSAGEPDFNAPEEAKQAAVDAVRENFSRYTAVSGITELREKIREKLKKDNNLDYSADEIVVSTGAKQALYNTAQVLCNKGDEAIIPCPFWVSYKAMVLLAEAKPVFTCNETLKLTPEDLENSVTKKTKAVFLNYPNNPTGLTYSAKELEQLAEIAVRKNIFVISDEIYEKILFEGKHVSIASFNEEIKNLTITINGLSKSHAMTGYRIGYSASNPEIASAIKKIQGHSTGNPCSVSQKAAISAFNSDEAELKKHILEFKKRRDYITRELKNTKLNLVVPQGAFYYFFSIKEVMEDDIQFCNGLLEKKLVALVPGKAFGMPGYARISYAASLEEIKKGIQRIKEFIE